MKQDDEGARAVTIRRATTADKAALGTLGALLVQEHYDFDRLRFLAPSGRTPDAYASFLAGQLDDPNAIVMVADDGTQVIGYAFAAMQGYDYMALLGPAGVLHDVIVLPGHRGFGVGRRLIDAILAALKARGAPRVVLSTANQNESAQRLFERMGFRRTMVEMTRELEDGDNAIDGSS